MLGDRLLDPGRERDAVALAPAQLLLSAHEHCGHELVRKLRERLPHDVRIVLPVDDRQRPHVRGVISESMPATCFSYLSVSVEKRMIRSRPWYGYWRQTSTCGPSTWTTL